MSPLIKQNTAVPNTGLHKRVTALRSTGRENSLATGARTSSAFFTHTDEATNTVAATGTAAPGGRSVTKWYTIKLATLQRRT